MGLLDPCEPIHNTLQVHAALHGLMIIKQYSTKQFLFFYFTETTSDNSCFVLSGLSLRGRGRGFPPATNNMAHGFFHREIHVDEK